MQTPVKIYDTRLERYTRIYDNDIIRSPVEFALNNIWFMRHNFHTRMSVRKLNFCNLMGFKIF